MFLLVFGGWGVEVCLIFGLTFWISCCCGVGCVSFTFEVEVMGLRNLKTQRSLQAQEFIFLLGK